MSQLSYYYKFQNLFREKPLGAQRRATPTGKPTFTVANFTKIQKSNNI